MSISIIAVVVLIFLDNETPQFTPSSKQKVEEKVILVQKKLPIPVKEKIVVSQNTLKLQPSLNFVKNMQYTHGTSTITPAKVHHPKVAAKKEKIKPQTPLVDKTSNVVIEEQEKISRISITRKDSNEDLQNIIKRFKKSNDPRLSLFIAKKYYAHKNYKEAYNYALTTNKLNTTIDDSWIIFSKSLVKLGKKKFAIKVLQDYVQNTQSTPATILLSDIKSGKFR